MENKAWSFRHRSLSQQGYDYTPQDLKELDWALRFTPGICMLLAICGLVTQQAYLHFALAALGILPFWAPAWHPLDRLYNHGLRPLWNGVRLPPNPLPRRIACLMGGAMNIGIGLGFLSGNVPLAYVFGAILIPLQIVVISTHFCLASWLYEGMLRLVGKWTPLVEIEAAKRLVADGARLVDVRQADEFARGHLQAAINIPLDLLEERIGEVDGETLVLYCKSGLRSQQAAQLLKKQNRLQVYNLGSMARW